MSQAFIRACSVVFCARSPDLTRGLRRRDRRRGQPVSLHGYPQCHANLHDVAPTLAKRYTVIAPDLPGYGKSRVLDAGPWHKRAVGTELVAMMHALGHDRFAVIGHDRGARVGYRLALDHPDSVSAYCSLAVVPTLDVWPAVDRHFAQGAFHWFLFLQLGDLPEGRLAADPMPFLVQRLTSLLVVSRTSIPPLWPLTAKHFVRLRCAVR